MTCLTTKSDQQHDVFLEPECRVIRDLTSQKNFDVFVSFHSGERRICFPHRGMFCAKLVLISLLKVLWNLILSVSGSIWSSCVCGECFPSVSCTVKVLKGYVKAIAGIVSKEPVCCVGGKVKH